MQALETCDESVVKKWQDLEEQRRLLVAHVAYLQQCLANFSEHPFAHEILRRKEAYAQAHADLEHEVRPDRDNIRWRTLALTDARAAAEITARRRKCEERLVQLTRLNAPAVILENERRLIRHCAAPIAELEESLKPRELELAYCRQLSENAAEEYRAAKRACKAELVTAEEELVQITEEQHRWVSTDREHLAWFLSHHSHRRDEMLSAYRLAHPDDTLRDLVPVEEQTDRPPTPVRPPSKKRRRALNGDAGAGQADPEPAEAAQGCLWTLVYVNDPPTVAYPLARNRKQALRTIGALLQKQRFAVSPDLILTKLTVVTGLSIQRRQGLKQVLGQNLHGWKIIRVGVYRVLLDIDEEKRTIRFLVRPRKESYDR